MVQATRVALATLALCAAFVAPAVARRQLQQTGRTIHFPGCSFLSDSEIAKDEDFSTLFTLLEKSGLNDTLANLTTPHTLFAPTNDAFADFLMAVNITVEEALAETVSDLLLGHVVPANVQDALDNMGVIVLPTLLDSANLTIMADEVNSTEVVTVVSYGSEATVVTPAAYACNLVIYGIDGVLVPEEVLFPFEAEMLVTYLTATIRPGSAEIPLSLIVEAVGAGETAPVATAFLTALTNDYMQQLLALYAMAVGNQEALMALAAVGNGALQQSSCATLTPFLQQLPSAADLQQTGYTSRVLQATYPALTECLSIAKGL